MALNRMHDKREYFGEKDAKIVIAWVNARKNRNDAIARLLLANAGFYEPGLAPFEAAHKIRATLHSLLHASHVGLAPVLTKATPERWTIDWRRTGTMNPRQSLAFFKLLELAEEGLLGRVRRCALPTCSRWFYARVEHKKFHSFKCQQQAFRDDPDWREKRRVYMRRKRNQERKQKLKQ
jgi:hypothetical protein